MKKRLVLLTLACGISLPLIGCTVNSPINSDKESGNSENDFSKVEVEEGTPQEWLDLFAFTNVTIVAKDTLLLKREGREFRCVDSKWYVKEQGDTIFNNFNEDPATIYQIAYSHYSKFTYYEDLYYYKAENMKVDDTDFSYTVTVMLDVESTERRVGWLYSSAFISDSLSTESSLEFKNYGTTVLA